MQGEGGFDAAALMDAAIAIVSTWGLRVVGALVLFIVGLITMRHRERDNATNQRREASDGCEVRDLQGQEG